MACFDTANMPVSQEFFNYHSTSIVLGSCRSFRNETTEECANIVEISDKI